MNEHPTGLRESRELSLERTPGEIVSLASTQAKLLMEIVEKAHCYQQIGSKKYLQVEAWETIGAFNQIHAVTNWVNPILIGDEIVGYKARVALFKDETVVGVAEMPCYFTENCCKGKEGNAKHKAAMSAAQTFATSKAYRMNFSYIAILAGYEPTPAEEMDSEPKVEVVQERICSIHNVRLNLYTKGDKKWYAHKVDGTDGDWCNGEEVKSKRSVTQTPAPEQGQLYKPDYEIKE